MEKFIIWKIRIDASNDRLTYVTSMDSGDKALRFCTRKNSRSIDPDIPDTMYNYFYAENLWYECEVK